MILQIPKLARVVIFTAVVASLFIFILHQQPRAPLSIVKDNNVNPVILISKSEQINNFVSTPDRSVLPNYNAASESIRQTRRYDPAYDYYDNETLLAMANIGDSVALLALARKLSYREPLKAVEYDFMALVKGEPAAAEHAARIYRGLANHRISVTEGAIESTDEQTEVNRDDLINSYAWGLVGQLYGNANSGVINNGLRREALFAHEEVAVACNFAKEIYAQVELVRIKQGISRSDESGLLTSFDLSRGTQECPTAIAERRYACQRRDDVPSRQTLDAFVCRNTL